jgi:hypothetical protein
MKTALTELSEWMEKTEFLVSNEFIIKFSECIKKEKEQLQVSFISGAIEALSSYTPVKDRIKDGYFEDKAEQYFNHIYRQNYTNENR